MEERCDQIMDCIDETDEDNCKLISFKDNYNKKVPPFTIKGLFPYYIISYNKQGSFQMIIEDYNKGPRVVRKDYVL